MVAQGASTRCRRKDGHDDQQIDGGFVMVRPLLTAKDLAFVLKVGERTVWRMASMAAGGSGPFPRPIRIGGQAVRWRWQDVEKYLEELAGK